MRENAGRVSGLTCQGQTGHSCTPRFLRRINGYFERLTSALCALVAAIAAAALVAPLAAQAAPSRSD